MNLQAGQKLPLSNLMGASLQFEVAVTFNASFEIDVTVFGLNANEKLYSDDYMVYFNQPVAPNSVIVMSKSAQTTKFKFDLSRLDHPAVEKFVICAAIDSPNHCMENISHGHVSIIVNGAVVANFPISHTMFIGEKAVMLAQIYKKNDWRFGAIAQGFKAGLPALVEHFGGEVKQEPIQPPKSIINLSKIKLDKENPTISLTKKSGSFGRIAVNLNWNQHPPSLKKSFSLFGSSSAVDLDLCALIEYKHEGIYAIQALGDRFGYYDDFPYVFLDGDDRAGTISQGENLYINGSKWDEIKRIVIFAAIYDGVASWSETDGVINIKIPNQPELEVRLADNNNKRLCAIIELSNQGGAIKANREVRYFEDIYQMDRHYRFGFRIVEGSKD